VSKITVKNDLKQKIAPPSVPRWRKNCHLDRVSKITIEKTYKHTCNIQAGQTYTLGTGLISLM